MIKIISECNDFIKDCGFLYAICGGYALELFRGTELRSHSDIDISVFEENKTSSIDFVLSNGWNVYEHIVEWDFENHKKGNSCLMAILSSSDTNITGLKNIWVIKLDCSFFKIVPRPNEGTIYDYEILNSVQLNFDFFEIVFNKQEEGNFVLDTFSSQNQFIIRELDKAILRSKEGIPYLAPEVILSMMSHPEYLKSDFHKTKNQIDYDSTAPMLSKESRDWLINALEIAYPDGNSRIEQLKNLEEIVC